MARQIILMVNDFPRASGYKQCAQCHNLYTANTHYFPFLLQCKAIPILHEPGKERNKVTCRYCLKTKKGEII